MPNCPECGALYGVGDDFCPQCGKQFKKEGAEKPKSSFSKAWVVTIGIIIISLFALFFLFSTSQVGIVKPSPQMVVVPEPSPKIEAKEEIRQEELKRAQISSDACKIMNGDNSFCVDNMPDFPELIGDFSLKDYNKRNWRSECNNLEGEEACAKSIRVEYYNEETQEAIHVIPSYIIKGATPYFNYFKSNLLEEEIEENIFRSVEEWELFWRTNTEFDFIMTQTYLHKPREDGSIISKVQTADVNNEVIQHFLNKYPTTSI